jgi:hypothetical protein
MTKITKTKTKKKGRLNAQAILAELAEIRKVIPHADVPRKDDEGATAGARTEEDFEYLAVMEGLRSLSEDLEVELDRRSAALLEQSLEIYYTAEELARDPAHADLIPHVEAMRAAYERDFGIPIPPRK